MRLLLAALLFFGSDVLLWTNPPGYTPLEWLVHIVGHIAMSALLLDLALHFRARNLFGLLALAGIYGLCASLLLHPTITLADLPASLFARALGAQSFAALLMLLLYLHLLRPASGWTRWLPALIGAAVGVGWGVWARWSPSVIFGGSVGETLLGDMIAAVGASLIVISALLLAAQRVGMSAARLSRGGWAVLALALLALLALRWTQGAVDSLALTVIALLLVFCGLILWFLRSRRVPSLFESASAPPNTIIFALAALLFVLGGVAGYPLPRGEAERDPVALIGLLFTTFGLVWLPTVSLVLGGRTFLRQVQAQKL